MLGYIFTTNENDGSLISIRGQLAPYSMIPNDLKKILLGLIIIINR